MHRAFVVKIIPRCNNCGLFFANAFTLHVSGDIPTHHQEYVLYVATGKQAHLVSKFVPSKLVLSGGHDAEQQDSDYLQIC